MTQSAFSKKKKRMCEDGMVGGRALACTKHCYVKSAQNQFLLVTQFKRMIDRTGEPVEERIAEERESSNAQIRTMLDEQRRTIVAEYGEKVLHHELLAAQAEQDRKILQEELLRQQQYFREVHQQDLMKMKEFQKFQNSTFDELTKQKFIEDQKIIMELSGRLQELQNEVNCMSDSKDFRDAESICSGNSHVTSPPGIFPRHPPFEGLLKPAFISPRRTDGPPNIRDTSGKETFLHIHKPLHQLHILRNWIPLGRRLLKNQFTCLQRRKVEDQSETQIWDASPDRQPKIWSSSVEETLQRIMGQTNNDCRFRIFILTSSPRLACDRSVWKDWSTTDSQSTWTLITPNRRDETHQSRREPKGRRCLHPLHVWAPGLRKHGQLHNPRRISTSSSTLAQLLSAR